MDVNATSSAGVTRIAMTAPDPATRPVGVVAARRTATGVVDDVAKLVGMTSDQLRSALDSGRSLLDVSSSRGASTSTLLSTIQQSIASSMPPPVDNATTARLALRIADHHRPGGVEGSGSTEAVSGLATTDVVSGVGSASSPDAEHGGSGFHQYL